MMLLSPTPEQQQRMDKELPPDPEMRKQDIIALREWLSKQPHLPSHIDNDRLERFLYNCKNSIERCKLILERYYSVRTVLPEFFTVRDPRSRDIQEAFNTVEFFVLPSLTEEGYRVNVYRLRDTSVEKFSMQAMIRRVLMALDIRLMEEACLSNIVVIDFEGSTLGHFAKCSPTLSTVKRGISSVQRCMPYRIFNVHFLHSPSFIINIVNAFRAFFNEKFFKKFHIHNGGGEELHAYINKDILPNEWGGKAGTFEVLNVAWQEKLEKYRDWLLRDEKLSRTDEKARLQESKIPRFLIEPEGIQGSFRKLNID